MGRRLGTGWKYALVHNRLFLYILGLYLAGFLFGAVLLRGAGITPTAGNNFLSVFCTNYWYFFLIWIFGYSVIGLFFTSLIVFFRGFLFGALMALLIGYDFGRAGLMILTELFLMIPVLFLLSYVSLAFSYSQLLALFQGWQPGVSLKFYNNVMLLTSAVVLIYSIIIAANG